MSNPNDIVICNPKRTAVGRYGGAFVGVPVQDLAGAVVNAVIEESGIDTSAIDDVIFGQASPNGAAPALGRVVALDALGDAGIEVPGMQLDRRCGSGLQAVATAAAHIAAGAADVIIAGGAESMSNTEYTVDGKIRWGAKGGTMQFVDRLQEGREKAGGTHHPIPGGMIETAENLREKYAVSRERQDALAAESHRRAAAAQAAGDFDAEIVPVEVPQRKGDPVVVDQDEHIRPGTTEEQLAKLRPVMKIKGASVTAGNASGQNDGAAAMIVTTREKAEELGLTPAVVLRGWAVSGVAPETMGIGPVTATEKVFGRLGLTFDDIDLIELNEAFAAQALAVLDAWGISEDDPRLNPVGSGISLGHPVGATGARMVVTAAHEMARTDAKRALVTMCIGGGQGMAAVLEKA